MTSMEQAMKQAGVALPLIHRVWLVVKDHPGADCGKIASILKVKRSHASSSLADLAHRKMVVVSPVSKNVRSGKGFAARQVLTYCVPTRMTEYELLPRSHKPRSKPRKVAEEKPVMSSPPASAVEAAPPAPVTAPVAAPVAAPVTAPVAPVLPQPAPTFPKVPTRTEIDSWPLADARQVYDYLRDYFTP